MAKSNSAEDTVDSGAATDDSLTQDEVVKDSDKDFVPKTQFLAAINSANEKNRKLEIELAELRGRQSASTNNAVEPSKVFTRAELTAAVTAGQITQDVADEIFTKQITDKATAEAEARILGTVRAEGRQDRINSEIEEYKRLAPEILDDSHETRKKVQEEFNFLVSMGDDSKSLITQLKAIRAVLGSVDKLKLAKSGRREAEHDEQVGGGNGGSNSRTPKTLVDSLSPREKTYYEGLIARGQLKDWKAVEEELKFASPDVRRKAGNARA